MFNYFFVFYYLKWFLSEFRTCESQPLWCWNLQLLQYISDCHVLAMKAARNVKLIILTCCISLLLLVCCSFLPNLWLKLLALYLTEEATFWQLLIISVWEQLNAICIKINRICQIKRENLKLHINTHISWYRGNY